MAVYGKWYKDNTLAVEELNNVLTIYREIADQNSLESKVVCIIKEKIGVHHTQK